MCVGYIHHLAAVHRVALNTDRAEDLRESQLLFFRKLKSPNQDEVVFSEGFLDKFFIMVGRHHPRIKIADLETEWLYRMQLDIHETSSHRGAARYSRFEWQSFLSLTAA